MSTGVHGVAGLAGEFEAGGLGQRQPVHVSAQQHGGSGRVTLEHGGDAGCRLVEGDLERQAVQSFEHRRPGLRQVVAELGAAVQPAPQRQNVFLDLLGS